MNILIVDDEQKGRTYLSTFLRDIGHAVAECPNGEAALAAFNTQKFQIVLTDIRMPGMSGIDLLRSIHGLPNGQDVSIILITGYADLKTAVEAMRCGAYDYLQKPIKLEELTIAIERTAEHQALRRENKFLTSKFESAVRVSSCRNQP